MHIIDERQHAIEIPEKFEVKGDCDIDDDLTFSIATALKRMTPVVVDGIMTWTVQMGPTMFSPEDFTPRKVVIVNDKKVGEICLEKMMDLQALGRK
jgi:hypothetical protein